MEELNTKLDFDITEDLGLEREGPMPRAVQGLGTLQIERQEQSHGGREV